MISILIVDDEPDVQSALQLMLELEGYEVSCAYDGEEGLRCAAEAPPDLIISDIMMPRMDGFEMCERLRRDPMTRDIPIILSSSIEPEEDRESFWDAFVSKTAPLDELVQAIKRLTDDRRDASSGSG